jgi:enoyl-CoA hydratase
MNLETVNLAVSEGVARIELNRPDKANAMWQDILAAFRRVDEMTEARVAVISGRGKYFTSGIDLDMLAGLRQQMQDDCDGRSSERLRRT